MLRENRAERTEDTKGINVWCAAWKGTFGTEELIRRIETSGLAAVVSHRTLTA
jgi:hypothetical protein